MIGHVAKPLLEILTPLATFLSCSVGNVTSQSGEDGVIAALFAKIGTTNKWCFEVGAWDGIGISNTYVLRDSGWSAVLIESDDKAYRQLTRFASPTVHCVQAHIVPGDLGRILFECGAPNAPDFGVIDIDGQDWWIWDSLAYTSRVMLVEYGWSENIPPLGSKEGQANFNAIVQLGERKGYTALMRVGVNVLFCRSGLL